MSAFSELVLSLGAVHYWRLGEAVGSSVCADIGAATPLFLSATSVDFGVPGSVAGDSDTAAYLNGTTASITENVENFRASDSTGTIVVAFKTTADSFYLFSSANSALNYLHRLDFLVAEGGGGGVLRLIHRNGEASSLVVTSDRTGLNDGLWHLAVLSSDGDEYRMYIDGDEVGVSGNGNTGRWFAGIANRTNVSLGCTRQNGEIRRYLGYIDECAVFARPLSPQEVAELYQAWTAPFVIAGTITDGNGLPASRIVRAYRRSDGRYVGETVSDQDGHYVLRVPSQEEYTRIVLADDDAEGVVYNDIVDRIIVP